MHTCSPESLCRRKQSALRITLQPADLDNNSHRPIQASHRHRLSIRISSLTTGVVVIVMILARSHSLQQEARSNQSINTDEELRYTGK